MRRLLAAAGAVLVLAGLTILVAARWSLGDAVYVSEMGAPGMPTAGAFQVALVLIAAGGGSIAGAASAVRSRLLPLVWPALTILAASGCFLLISQVTCTSGCPLPLGPTFTWQDFIHTGVAVLGFALAGFAMLQVAFGNVDRALRRLSLWSAFAVAGVALAGAQFSLFRYFTDFGGLCEFVATALGLSWIALLGGWIALRAPASAQPSQEPRGFTRVPSSP